jgi:hypothetical protein
MGIFAAKAPLKSLPQTLSIARFSEPEQVVNLRCTGIIMTMYMMRTATTITQKYRNNNELA